MWSFYSKLFRYPYLYICPLYLSYILLRLFQYLQLKFPNCSKKLSQNPCINQNCCHTLKPKNSKLFQYPPRPTKKPQTIPKLHILSKLFQNPCIRQAIKSKSLCLPNCFNVRQPNNPKLFRYSSTNKCQLIFTQLIRLILFPEVLLSGLISTIESC